MLGLDQWLVVNERLKTIVGIAWLVFAPFPIFLLATGGGDGSFFDNYENFLAVVLGCGYVYEFHSRMRLVPHTKSNHKRWLGLLAVMVTVPVMYLLLYFVVVIERDFAGGIGPVSKFFSAVTVCVTFLVAWNVEERFKAISASCE